MNHRLNYGAVGNCRTAALISETGNIEWLCLPEFDSPSIFAALLDREKGGCFGFEVSEAYRTEQSYIPHTNILSTHFISDEAEFTVLDFMPYYRAQNSEHYLPSGRALPLRTSYPGRSPVSGPLRSGSGLCPGKDHP